MSDKPKVSTVAPVIKWMREPVFHDGEMVLPGLDEFGREIGDPVPQAVQLGLSPAVDETHESLRRLFRQEIAALNRLVEDHEFETEEEANDFAVDDDMYPPGVNDPWEDVFELPDVAPSAASGATNGGKLADAAVKGGNRAPVDATPPVAASQTASVDLDAAWSSLTTEQKLKVAAAFSKSTAGSGQGARSSNSAQPGRSSGGHEDK